jgi:Na+-driven multidrug efflux pump
VRLCWKSAVLLMTAMGVFFVLGRDLLIGWMAPGSDLHAQLAAPLLVVCALAQPFFATCIVLKTSMRGAGATHIVMRWSFGSMFFYRVFALWIMPRFMEVSLTAVWIVLSLDLMTQAVIFSRLHLRGKWLDARV